MSTSGRETRGFFYPTFQATLRPSLESTPQFHLPKSVNCPHPTKSTIPCHQFKTPLTSDAATSVPQSHLRLPSPVSVAPYRLIPYRLCHKWGPPPPLGSPIVTDCSPRLGTATFRIGLAAFRNPESTEGGQLALSEQLGRGRAHLEGPTGRRPESLAPVQHFQLV